MSSGWVKSPYSNARECVETLRQIDGSVLVRNSNDRTGPFVHFTAAEYEAHEDGIRAELQRKNTAQGVHMANLEGLLIRLDRRLQDITALADEPCRTEEDLRFLRTRLRALLGVGA